MGNVRGPSPELGSQTQYKGEKKTKNKAAFIATYFLTTDTM